MSQFSPIPQSFIFQHPMRRIELQYMPEKTVQTKQDKLLVKKYLELHDFEYHLLKKTEELYISFCDIDTQVNILRKDLKNIRQKLNDSVEMADKLSEDTYIPAETSLEKIQENNAVVAEELITHNGQVQNLCKEVKYYQGILNSCIKTGEEGSENIYAEYDNIAAAHSQNYELNTIDIVSIDTDYEKFCSSREFYETRRNSFIHDCNKILDNCNTLTAETNMLYNLWTEFAKRCELIHVVATLHNSHISSSSN